MSGLLTATLIGSIAEDLDWLGTLLGGLTIMPYVSHSVLGVNHRLCVCVEKYINTVNLQINVHPL